ncbi:ER membrane protein complex subunit 9 [Hyalella azteca]|uniref:ER membrane protein complex subunit 9 n=1 Tax=Hyalella azteca TaxID=294128 RepID=A0A8B7PBD2_HYAAZ|nr:ER membrane protein complex subunit 9 [Hyalella azteca]
MSSNNQVNIKCAALAKIVLHSARWSHLAVNGVLLGPSLDAGKTSELEIVDAVPLFHQQLSLAPMLDVALNMVETHYRSKGLQIVGYYQANEHVKDVVPDFVAMKITEKIAENYDSACLIMLDNRKVCLQMESNPLIVSQVTQDGKWKNRDKSCVTLESRSLSSVSELLQKQVHQEIVDFDLHFDDISFNWTNAPINDLINSFVAA